MASTRRQPALRGPWSGADSQPAQGPRSTRSSRPRLCIVATPGGHLDLLVALRKAFEPFERVWVVSPSNTADSLRAEGECVRLVPRFHGYSLRNVRHATRSIAPLVQDRPTLVVTSGSGSVVPYCLGARAMGAKLIFLETMARVTNASAAGRALSPFASRVLVQWPEMAALYPGARVCRPGLLDNLPQARRLDGVPQGAFVAVGTHIDPFDRLLREVDEAVDRGVLRGPVIAQTGASGYTPRHFEAQPWMSPADIERAIATTRYMLCHAGSGLIARALAAPRTPIVLPRKAALGEHVDDHQLQIAERLAEYGLVVHLDGPLEARHLAAANMPRAFPAELEELPRMEDVLAEEFERLASPPLAMAGSN